MSHKNCSALKSHVPPIREEFYDEFGPISLAMFVLWFVYAFSASLWFWMNQALYPRLKNRDFALISMSTVGASLTFVHSQLNEALMFYGTPMPCDLYLWITQFILPTLTLPHAVRLYRMHNKLKLSEAIMGLNSQERTDPKAVVEIARLRKKTEARHVAIITVLIYLPFFVAISSQYVLEPWYGAECYGCSAVGHEAAYYLVVATVSVIMLLVPAYRLRNVTDTFQVGKELLLAFGIGGPIGILGLIVLAFDPGSMNSSGRFMGGWISTLGAFVVNFATLPLQVFLAKREGEKVGSKGVCGLAGIELILCDRMLIPRRRRKKNMGDSTTPTIVATSGRPDPAVMERQSQMSGELTSDSIRASGDEEKAQTSSLSSKGKGTARPSKIAKHAELENVLKDTVLSEALSMHMASEFSAEHIQCLRVIRAWKNFYSTFSGERRDTWAQEIFSNFIPEDAPMQINISAKMRQKLEGKLAFTAGDRNPDPIPINVFDEVEREIISQL